MFGRNMLNKKSNKLLYGDAPLNFRLLSFLVGEGYHVFIQIRLFAIVKDSPLYQRWPFGIANDIGDSEILVIPFSGIMHISIHLEQRVKEGSRIPG